MADLYLSRKLTRASSSSSGSGASLWLLASPTIGSRISRTSRASAVTTHEENDVEELEMLLEVVTVIQMPFILLNTCWILRWILLNLQAYFMQIDGTLNKLSTVCTKFVVYRLLFYLNSCICKQCRDILILIEADSPGILQSAGFFFNFFFGISLLAFSYIYIYIFFGLYFGLFSISSCVNTLMTLKTTLIFR